MTRKVSFCFIREQLKNEDNLNKIKCHPLVQIAIYGF